MRKEFTVHRKQYTGDGVIARGYEIYDEWNGNHATSQDVVSAAERTATAWQTNGTNQSCVEALACLFALDLRIREKYDKILHYVFSYSSFRREIGALKLLKSAFHIPDGENDIRTTIEIELQKLRKRMETEDEDEEDDGTHGGKTNQASDEESVMSEEEPQEEQISEQEPDQVKDSREASESSEEPTQELDNHNLTEQQAEETEIIEEQSSSTETLQQEAENELQNETETVNREQPLEVNEVTAEEAGEQEKPEQSADANRNMDVYNNAPDFFSFPEEAPRNRTVEARTYAEELLIDEMLKWNANGEQQESLENVGEFQPKKANEEKQVADKGAFLYDRTAITSKTTETDNAPQTAQTVGTAKTESAQNAQKAPQNTAPEQNPMQNYDTTDEIAEGFDDLRVSLHLDLDQENAMRLELDRNMDEQQVAAFIKGGLETMREKMIIASAEFGMEAPVELVGEPDLASIKQVDAVRSK